MFFWLSIDFLFVIARLFLVVGVFLALVRVSTLVLRSLFMLNFVALLVVLLATMQLMDVKWFVVMSQSIVYCCFR